MDIPLWLRQLGLERYNEAFADNDIDGDVLAHLTAEDLLTIGVKSVGHRRKLLAAIVASADASAVTPSQPNDALAAGAERRQVTVLFSDLVGSTSMSAQLDPEEMRDIILAYQNAVAGEVARVNGHVAKFMGDGVLAYFGYPRSFENSAERAVRAGLRIVEAVDALTVPSPIPLQARVGIASGLVVVGDLIGDGSSEERAVVGDTPNLAARLQSVASPSTVAISDRSHQLVGELFTFEDLGELQLKGFDSAMRAWRVTGEGTSANRFEAFHGSGLGTLVGREEELGLLLARWKRASDGEGQLVVISGEAGIGKSHLTESLVARVAVSNGVTLRLFGSPYRSETALYPAIALIERFAGIGGSDSLADRQSKLTGLLGRIAHSPEDRDLLHSLLGLPFDPSGTVAAMSPPERLRRTLEALIARLVHVATRVPVLLVVEDAHWLDPTSLDHLDDLVRMIQELPVMVLMTHRPEFQRPHSGHLATLTSLTLGRLTRSDSREVITSLVHGRDVPEEVVNQIIDRTEGVPLFVEELTKMLVESDYIAEQNRIGHRHDPSTIPATLYDSLMSRLDRLETAKELAQVGSIIGRTFDRSLVSALVADGTDVERGLEELIAAELVFRRVDGANETFVFKHALVQEAAYESLLTSARRGLHRRLVEYIVRHRPGMREAAPELLARHFTAAAMMPEAIEHRLLAGERALQRSEMREATLNLQLGLDLIESSGLADGLKLLAVRLHTALGTVHLMANGQGTPEVEAEYRQAWTLAEDTPNADELFPPLFGLWRFYLATGYVEQTHESARRLLEIANEAAEPYLEVAAHTTMALTLFHAGDLDAASRHAERGFAIYNSSPSAARTNLFMMGQDPRVASLSCLALCSSLLGRFDEANAAVMAAEDIAVAETHPFSLGAALLWQALTLYLAGDTVRATEVAERCIALSQRHNFPIWEALVTIVTGAADPDAEASAATITRGLNMLERTGTYVFRAFGLARLADAHLRLGQIPLATAMIDEAMTLANARNERWYQPEFHRLRGTIAQIDPCERALDAVAHFALAVRDAEARCFHGLGVTAATDLAEELVRVGRRGEALAVITTACGHFADDCHVPVVDRARSVADRLRLESIFTAEGAGNGLS